jgi:predicted Rossmann fold nucleotide-binding protein DprA/Smf involved in DNA uptake
MKLAIVGSRKFNNYELLCQSMPAGIHEIVSGGAKGADTLAEQYAGEHNLPIKVFLPRFQAEPGVGYHPGHYHQRNRQIAEYADHILAFMPQGGSKGTKSTLNYAKKIGTPYTVVYF